MTIANNLSFLMNASGALTTGSINASFTPITLSVANSLKAEIDPNGYLLINTATSQGSYFLQVQGSAYVANTLTVSSILLNGYALSTSSGGGGASVTISDSAPSNPAVGNLWWDSAVGNLAIYYSDSAGSQWVDAVSSYVFPPTVNNLSITTATQSVSTTTGALTVAGGVGIGGALYVQGPMFVSGLAVDSGSTLTNLVITTSTQSTSTTTGALTVAGGAGIGGNLNVGGTLLINGQTLNPVIISDSAPSTPAAGQLWWDSSIGNLAIYYTDTLGGQWVDAVSAYVFPSSVNNLSITTSTQSASTTTGALVVAGGVGVGGAIYAASTSYAAGAQIITTATIGLYASNNSTGTTATFIILSTASTNNTNSGALQVVGGAGIFGGLYVGGSVTATNFYTAGGIQVDSGSTFTNIVVTGTNVTTSTTTGALVVAGGVGVGGGGYFGGVVTATSISVTGGGGGNISGVNNIVGVGTFTAGSFTATSVIASTSTTTGAVVVAGGVGVGGAVYINTTSFIAGAQIITTATIGNYAVSTATFAAFASTASSVSVTASSSATNFYLTFISTTTGTLSVISDAGNYLTYNPGVGVFSISTATVSTGTTTGAVVIAGGLGVGGAIYAGQVFAGGIQVDSGSTFTNLVVTGLANLGTVSNITITGGLTGQVLTTNGSGVLSWSTATGGGGATLTTTSAAANYYVTFASTQSGSFTTAYNSNNLYFNASSNTLYATVFQSLSDERQKANISVISNGLEIVENLRGVTFDWIDRSGSSAGLIAQEVERWIPQLVDTSDKGIKTLNYSGVIGVLVEAVKTLSDRVKTLENK